MIKQRQIGVVALCLGAFMCCLSTSAMEYVFPAAARVVDITKAPYSADRTRQTDVSAILSKAALDIIGVPGWGPGILYMPNGTYLVRNTFQWSINPHGNGVGPIVIGQSRTGTVIKLAKGTWPVGNEQKGVIWTGAGDENNFNKGIRNLTVLVDSNNAGAIGIIYVSDNIGMITDVDVISADGKGIYGIQSAGGISGVGGNGPFIIRRTFIKGFAIGFRGCASEGEMMSQIRIQGQSKYGIWVSCGDLILDSLYSENAVYAVYAQAPTLVTNAVLVGGSPDTYGIYNSNNSSFFRNVTTSGYRSAVYSSGTVRPPTTASFDQYSPSPSVSLFPSSPMSMNLPAKYPPDVAWETDFAKWAFIEDYRTNGRNDAQAFQAAIDDPTKTTVCLREKMGYQMTQPVYVRGNISRIIGTGGTLNVVNKTSSQLIFEDGTAPVVVIQLLSGISPSEEIPLQVIKRSTRTLVLESICNGYAMSVLGGGETYVTDVTGSWNVIDNAQARVYMWQWEGPNCLDSTFVVRNGMVRAVGFYDECTGTPLVCTGGITEILGVWEYSTMCNHNGKFLLTVKNNANVSAAGMFQQNFCNPWGGYDQLVSETRSGTTKILYGSAGTGRVVSPAGGNVALFTAYDSSQVQQALGTRVRRSASPNGRGGASVSVFRKAAGTEILYRTQSSGPVTLVAYDLAGKVIATVPGHTTFAGMHRTMLPRIAGVACIQVRSHDGTAQLLSVAHVN